MTTNRSGHESFLEQDGQYFGRVIFYNEAVFICDEHKRLYEDFEYNRSKRPFRKVKGKPRITAVKDPTKTIRYEVAVDAARLTSKVDAATRHPFINREDLDEFLLENRLVEVAWPRLYDHSMDGQKASR